jgi:DNA-binding response OmpR family regulator
MLTAKDDIEDELQAMSGGAVSYIVKPSHRDTLVQTVSATLEKARGTHPSES